jgi:hypothetical protein
MRAVTVQVGPLAASSANKIALSQLLAATAGGYIVLNGAAGSFSANNICTTQTPAGAANLTINGAAASGGIAYLGIPKRVYITTAADETAKTFTIYGTNTSPSGGLYGVVETITGASTSVTSTSALFQTVTRIAASGATTGAITVGAYGTATLDTARRVLWTTGGNDTGITATIIGNNASGYPQTEVLTGVSGTTTYTQLDFLTISSILLSGAAATTAIFGTNGVASSPWAQFDEYGVMGPTSIQVDGSGTVSWTVQQTLNDPNSATNAVNAYQVDWVSHPDSALVASTTTTGVQGNYAYPPKWARVLMNSNGGTTAYAKATFIQNYQK